MPHEICDKNTPAHQPTNYAAACSNMNKLLYVEGMCRRTCTNMPTLYTIRGQIYSSVFCLFCLKTHATHCCLCVCVFTTLTHFWLPKIMHRFLTHTHYTKARIYMHTFYLFADSGGQNCSVVLLQV